MSNLIARAIRKLLFRGRHTYMFGAFAVGEREMRDIGKLFR